MFEELLARLDQEMTETELRKVLQEVTQSSQLNSAQRLQLLRVVGARLKNRPDVPQVSALSSATVRAVDGDV